MCVGSVWSQQEEILRQFGDLGLAQAVGVGYLCGAHSLRKTEESICIWVKTEELNQGES